MSSLIKDGFKEYYTEKLWEMIPAVYRHEDGLADNPGVLRALVEVVAEQAAILRRSQDQLWDDQFIELCNDWVVPYLADLLGTRLVSAKDKRGRRIDVAKTIYYRRRKGTLRVLEELISDVCNWEGKVVENFHRLGRARHGLDPKPAALAGRFSCSLPGGWADLRQQHVSELVGGPFNEFHHTVDVRQHRGKNGHFGIPKLAFHLYRLPVYKVLNSTPFFSKSKGLFGFDPSGRGIPLFMPRRRSENWDDWRSALEWELPAPIRCRLLGHAEYKIKEALIHHLHTEFNLSADGVNQLRKFSNVIFTREEQLRTALKEVPEVMADLVFSAILEFAIINDCGKNALMPNAIAVDSPLTQGTVPPHLTTSGHLSNGVSTFPQGKQLIIDPEQGLFSFSDDISFDSENVSVNYHYGFSGPVGAGTYDRAKTTNIESTNPPISGGGILRANHLLNNINLIEDSKTYSLVRRGNPIVGMQRMILLANDRQRPYIRLQSNWILDTRDNRDAELVLDGLWVGAAGNYKIILKGNYECVVIRNCTLDPGRATDINGNAIPPVPLLVEGQVEKLIIDSSITSSIRTLNGGYIDMLHIDESIIISTSAGVTEFDALAIDGNMVKINRTTVLGRVTVHRLQASEALIKSQIFVKDTQSGCFRFGAAPASSLLPRPYESFLFKKFEHHWFTSLSFGQPGFGQLSPTSPIALHRGAENGAEIGAFNSLLNPIKRDSLRSKVDEYMPFGLIPIFIEQT